MRRWKKQIYYHALMLPGMIFLIIFSFVPMFGIIMAFQNYIPAKGILKSKWVNWDNFKFIFTIPDSKQIFLNTIIIAFGKMLLGIIVPVCFALLLNEISRKVFKKTVQTIVYLPHFLSWVVLAAVVQYIFAYDGPINSLRSLLSFDPIMFMGSNKWFRPIMIFTESWKEFGYGSIIYLAALTGIDPGLYEAAAIDGANRWRRLLHITLPGILPIILIMTTMSLPNILNAGFDQIFNLYNPLVYESGDIIDTYIYRVGMLQRQYSLATAVGLIKSVIGALLIAIANKLVTTHSDRTMF
ncbi:putative aldouronate transport system permease protein [Lachnotalea glycerini]|uniref:Putative aldouronate transport system permease protein n=1 Tax=Lachnotalea glycerini TaxID=1763509 RepID=A0A255I692_9FIRM|nr:ABC transporter permease subunit [Lachnotalea glycerini]PXV91213.1 putative aldouronate transport system permease protein [Lachnotalea glycerini]RDY31625.1 sugar ABC transporter permease [Lachnotalea glycerini]